MISNMPIMLTRFASGVNPSTNQSLVSQGFADGTTQAAGGAVGGVGSNNYSIDGATNNGSGRRIAASPNADMIQEMRVESSNFDAAVGHGTGLADFDDDPRRGEPGTGARRTISTGRTSSTS